MANLKQIGRRPSQVPTNADLGSMAYQDADNPTLSNLLVREKSANVHRFPAEIEINTDHEWSGLYNLSNSGNSPSVALFLSNMNTSITGSEVSLLFSAGGSGSGQHEIAVKRTGTNTGEMIFRRRTGGGTSADSMKIDTDGRLIMGNISADQGDYGLQINRKGTASSPPTFSFTWPAIELNTWYGAGPSSYIQKGDFLNASYGRIITNDSNTHNFAIIDISYDSGLSPMRLDGRGNLWLGHNRAAASTDSTNANSLRAAGKIYAGTGFNNNGVREYAQYLNAVYNNQTYTFDVPIQATGAGYTVYYECMYNHYGNTSYGAWRSGMFSFRSLSNSTYYDDNIINHGNAAAGSWTVTMVDAGTSNPKLRFTKSTGTYPGNGHGHIFVRGGLIE